MNRVVDYEVFSKRRTSRLIGVIGRHGSLSRFAERTAAVRERMREIANERGRFG
jgi:hypothetical protein